MILLTLIGDIRIRYELSVSMPISPIMKANIQFDKILEIANFKYDDI